MSYFISSRKRQDGSAYWRALREEWKDGKRTTIHIPMDQLAQYGLNPQMSLEDAKARVKQLNALARKDKAADRAKNGALASAKDRERVKSAHLPDRFCCDFEKGYLKDEMDIGKTGPEKYKKALSHWEYVQKMIAAVDLSQQHWFQHKRRFYSFMAKQETAPDYASKILRVLNLWGVFISMKTGTSYIPVPPPTGSDREMIQEAYTESEKRKKESAPISPEMLEEAKESLIPDQYRWVFVSIWFGLRPAEVDRIKKHSKVVRMGTTPVLMVYQPKLVALPKDERYKLIPVIYPEQKEALRMLQEEALDRPLVKTLQKYLGDAVNCYGGRKGFTDLMLEKGQKLEDISIWLGHTTIDRTWRDYKNKKRFSMAG